jgi:Mrp family chromosome partitioning ATPase
VGVGLAWAFLIELLLDRSVRRSSEFERSLRIPLFLSIPKQQLKKLKPPRKRRGKKDGAATTPTAGEEALVLLPGEAEPNPINVRLNPYHETLRDRLIGYFESQNLTHKPKLVALTSLGQDSGVTTMAAGLARCLSETGDGNVLLVDLTPGQGSAQHFHRGKVDRGLEELLETREGAEVQDRLYIASDASQGDKLSRLLPQRFAKLLPKMKSSDFDYIIFDMPPVSQISITPRLAGFMDMVLLVVESEKTNRDAVQRASALLAESNAHVGAVLNKTTNYVPNWLHQESPV